MGKYIAKLAADSYVEWSTVIDGPVSWIVSRDAAVDEWSEERVLRADEHGTSILDDFPTGETPAEIVRGNCAGPNGKELTLSQILVDYQVNNPAPYTVAG